ncbi:MAG TPA: RNA polymerase sigma factor [Kofleriaceae bacterium]|nr:RNA polymerase sigma factor [Kofleriaceae bacterium]
MLAKVRPHLKRQAERICGNSADAEDLVQEVMLRAVNGGMPADVRNIAAWLSATLRNLTIDYIRRRIRQPPHESIKDNPDNLTQLEPDGPEPAWSRITPADIHAALAELKPVYRDVYVLHVEQGLSYEAIAQRLGTTRITVGTRLSRARQKLREVLVERFGLGDHEP